MSAPVGKRCNANRWQVVPDAFVKERRSETDRLPDPTFRLSKRRCRAFPLGGVTLWWQPRPSGHESTALTG